MKDTNGILAVHNWAKYQHYKNRRPPWIKLSTHVFQDYKFARLTNDSKLLLICIWTMASDSEHGTVPDDLEFIRQQGCLGRRIRQANVDELLAVGLLERFKDASEMLAHNASNLLAQSPTKKLAVRKQSAPLETERETQRTLASEAHASVLAETETETETENLPAAAQKPAAAGGGQHTFIRTRIQQLYQSTFAVKCSWTGREGSTLKKMLQHNPSWKPEHWELMLENYFASEGINGDRPCLWLPYLSRYAKGPLDRYGKLKNGETKTQRMLHQADQYLDS